MPSSNETPAKRLLVVDNDESIQRLVAGALSHQGFDVAYAADASAVKVGVRRFKPDLVLVEWALPGTSGLEVMRWIRRYYSLSHAPVIFLAERADENDRVLGLESGAEDYITKPFSTLELIARINAVLRRTDRKRNPEVIRADDLTLDAETNSASIGDRFVALGPLEFRLLAFLMAHPERVHSRTQLLERVWGNHAFEIRTVDVEISRLRRVLGAARCNLYIQTVHRVGYRFSTRR